MSKSSQRGGNLKREMESLLIATLINAMKTNLAQSAGDVEYTDGISAEGNAEYSFAAITLRSTLSRSDSTW